MRSKGESPARWWGLHDTQGVLMRLAMAYVMLYRGNHLVAPIA